MAKAFEQNKLSSNDAVSVSFIDNGRENEKIDNSTLLRRGEEARFDFDSGSVTFRFENDSPASGYEPSSESSSEDDENDENDNTWEWDIENQNTKISQSVIILEVTTNGEGSQPTTDPHYEV